MSELFSEIYNCYFQVIQRLITAGNRISERELNSCIKEDCFEESIFYLLPKLTENGWGFYHKQKDILYTKFSPDFYVPLTDLQKSYLKSILMDDKIQLFFSDADLKELNSIFKEIDPLFLPEDFYYYDRFSDGDNYRDCSYRKHFRMILQSISKQEYLNIEYESGSQHRVHHIYLPCRLEYSIKNDCFRLLAVERNPKRRFCVETINLNRIKTIIPTHKKAEMSYDLNKLLRRSYYKEPVRILIKNERNALERAMLQFANYEKNTKKIGDSTYECQIYYNKSSETELLIEILSFGPMIKVIGNRHFLELVKERLLRQKELISRSAIHK